jgi:hypothetical protein
MALLIWCLVVQLPPPSQPLLPQPLLLLLLPQVLS